MKDVCFLDDIFVVASHVTFYPHVDIGHVEVEQQELALERKEISQKEITNIVKKETNDRPIQNCGLCMIHDLHTLIRRKQGTYRDTIKC